MRSVCRGKIYADPVSSTQREADIRSIQAGISQLVRGSRKALITNVALIAPEMAPAAFVIMTQIADTFPASPAALIAATGLDRSVVSRHLTALTRDGYLVSEPDPHDGRVALFSPTPDAEEKFSAVSKARHGWTADVVSDWTQQDVSVFVLLLDRFNQSAYGN